MFSPPRREKARADDSHFPKGGCRFILLHPEIKGLRCGCVGFESNMTMPGSMCDCGHQACYHLSEQQSTLVDRDELQLLKEKIAVLQEELDRERYVGRGGLADRLTRVEDLVEKNKIDAETDLKMVYRGVGGLWQSVGQINKKAPHYEDQVEALADDMQAIRNRLIEVDDASMRVEERVEVLENMPAVSDLENSRRRKASTPPDAHESLENRSPTPSGGQTPNIAYAHSQASSRHGIADDQSRIESFRDRVSSVGSDSRSWTVHISLLPTYSQPFPFEKDTAAYKRCLSCGLHRMVVIPDVDSFSFKTAVSSAFSEVLQGRAWEPLVARICDARNLRGLPMLRQLESTLLYQDYDAEFLKRNCAVVDESGKIVDLYIAMSKDTLSWVELKAFEPIVPGLEASWIYDPFLDGPDDAPVMNDGSQGLAVLDKLPAAGDIVLTWPSSNTRLKRTSSEVSRTPSFSSSAEGDTARAKFRRQCPSSNVDLVERRAEAV